MYVKVCNANAIATDGIYIGVPVGLVGGPRPYQDQFVGSSLAECMLVGAFSCIIRKSISGKREIVS